MVNLLGGGGYLAQKQTYRRKQIRNRRIKNGTATTFFEHKEREEWRDTEDWKGTV